jgi:hypothetical protein
MMHQLIDYLKTKAFWDNYIAGIAGMLTQIVLLSILVPIVIWFYNRRKNRLKKFNSLTVLFNGCNQILDQYVILLQFDNLGDTKLPNPVMQYWALFHDDEIKSSYFSSNLFGNLGVKTFCIEHCSNLMLRSKDKPTTISKGKRASKEQIDAREKWKSNCDIVADRIALQEIVNNIRLEIANFEKYLFYPVDNKNIVDQFSFVKAMFNLVTDALNEFIKTGSDDSKGTLIQGINASSVLVLEIFYNNLKFVDSYYSSQLLKLGLVNRNISVNREELLNKFIKLDKKYRKKSSTRSEWLLLIAILKGRFGKK